MLSSRTKGITVCLAPAHGLSRLMYVFPGTVGLRYTVDDEHLDMRYSVDRAAGWISPSTNRGVHKIRAPGWQSVDGYQSMPDDWRDAEDIEAEMETF